MDPKAAVVSLLSCRGRFWKQNSFAELTKAWPELGRLVAETNFSP
jgi:hypothetical protein